MRNLIVVLVVFMLTSCANVDLTKSNEVRESAPYALQILNDYIGQDQITINSLVGPVASLQNLYDRTIEIDSAESLYDFYVQNPHSIYLARVNWDRVIQIVGQHSVRHQEPIPDELKSWRTEVEKAWVELATAIETESKNVKAKAFSVLLLRIVSARAVLAV